MSRKLKIILYTLLVIAVLVAIVLVFLFKIWPEYQASLDSSERIFSMSDYKTAIEVKVPKGPEFFLIINDKDILSYIFIENQESSIIANQDIETKEISIAIPEIIEKLIENNELPKENITVINYGDATTFKKTVELINKILQEKNITCQMIEEENTLQSKAEELAWDATEDREILWLLYFKSRELIDEIPTESTSIEEIPENIVITKDMAEIYADTIYQKLIIYMINADVENQEINNSNMPIQYIPGDSENKIYPTSSSWYYIENYKVYAEITIAGSQNYTFCYRGTQQEKKEGTCS